MSSEPADRSPDGGTSARTRTIRELFRSPYAFLAVGVLLLEFSAGVTVYVTTAVLPAVIADLDAARYYPLIVSAASVGLFGSLVLAQHLLRLVGARTMLAVGLAATVLGSAASALAPSALAFAAGRLVAALGSGLLGVFGTTAVIATVPPGYRVRLFALTSAMWIVPGMVGPAGAVSMLHLIGWRWTMVLVLPLVLTARVLVARAGLGTSAAAVPARDSAPVEAGRAACGDVATHGARRPRRNGNLSASLLLPVGMALFVFGSAGPLGPWSYLGLLVAAAGAVALLPAGTVRLADGPPRFLALLAVVSFGYFGADSLLTAIGTRADGLPLMWVSVALGAAVVCWSLTSMIQPRVSGSHGQFAGRVLTAGIALMALGAGTVVLLQTSGVISGPTLLAAWCVTGAGMGLIYPILYLRATTGTAAEHGDPGALATAVLVAESAGSVLGGAVGSAIVDGAQGIGFSESAGLHAAMAVFAAVLVAALPVAMISHRPSAPVPDHPHRPTNSAA